MIGQIRRIGQIGRIERQERAALRGVSWIAALLAASLLLGLLMTELASAEVNSAVDQIVYNGNGTTKAFTFPFGVLSTAQVRVVCRTTATGAEVVQVLNSDYTLADDDADGDYTDGPGGTVTFITAPASGVQVWITRVPALTQTRDLDGTAYLRLATLEDALDNVAYQVQYLRRLLYRVPLIPETEAQVRDMNAVNAVTRAGTFLKWDPNGDLSSGSTTDATLSAAWTGIVSGAPTLGQIGVGKTDLHLDNVYDVRDYGAVCDGVTDDTGVLQDLIDALEAGSGGVILIPGPLKVTSTITFSGSIATLPAYSSNYYGSLELRGVGANAGILAGATFDHVTDANVLQCGSRRAAGNVDMAYQLILRDLIVDGGTQEVACIHGGTTPDNHTVEFDNLVVKGFTGAGGVGIEGGRITDGKINHCRIQGQGYGKGIVVRRAGIQQMDCKILYCHDGVYVPGTQESGVQMLGGAIIMCDSCLTFQGGSGNYNQNYVIGTWIGELLGTQKLITAEGVASPMSLTLQSCQLSYRTGETPSEPLLDFSGFATCTINLIGNLNWPTAVVTQVKPGATVKINAVGNYNMTFDTSLARPGWRAQGDVVAEPNHPAGTTFGDGGRFAVVYPATSWEMGGWEFRYDGGGAYRGRAELYLNDGSAAGNRTRVLYATNTGLGLGESAPNHKLDVVGDVNATGTATFAGGVIQDVNIVTADLTNFDPHGTHIISSNTAPITGALADGTVVGQRVAFVCKVAGNNIDITVAHHVTSDPEVIRLDTAKEWVELLWDGTDWVEVSGNGQSYP